MRGSGFCGLAVYHPKNEVNIGSLWRSAVVYGAAFLATVGRRYRLQASDTVNGRSCLPLFEYQTLDDLVSHLPHGTQLVMIEQAIGATWLPDFEHPRQALYILGAEDHGIPSAMLVRAHYLVQIPTVATDSLNVAVAGSIVLYDRFTKLVRRST